MRALRVLSAALALILAGAAPLPYGTLYGFTTVSGDREKALETQFLDIPSASGALDTAGSLAVRPRFAGSYGDRQAAIYLRDLLASFGFTATLETLTARVDVPKKLALTLYPAGGAAAIAAAAAAKKAQQGHGLFSRKNPKANASPAPAKVAKAKPSPSPTPTPIPASVAIALPPPAATPTPEPLPPVTIDLHEAAISTDPDTAVFNGFPYLAGSADGDVGGPLVYAAFGNDADFAFLAAHGIDVRGAILIVRNGREFRGFVARRAQAHGVAGVIFYDDPAEDGPSRGAPYPSGPYRPATAVRRGTVGEGVTIPVLPVSAANAQLLLASLHGPSAPAPWRGGLAAGYAIARGPSSVHLTVELTRKQTTLWNTIGVLGGTRTDQSVILGAHRDAWVYGASDNGSGIETLVEAARGLGYLAKNGWQPRRTIVIAAWDGEELGNYGTIAYMRKHGDELRYGGVAYLDAEHTVVGPRFGADAVAAIAGTVADATRVVDNPQQPGTSVFDLWGRFSTVLPPRGLESLSDLTSTTLFGSGIPSANAGFGGPFGVADTGYDTNAYASTFADPQFALHRSTGQLYGIIAMRIADADVVPYRFATYVPLIAATGRALALGAKAEKLKFDTAGLGASLARFNAAAKRFDTATANALTQDDGDKALEAARVLDVAVYGNDGYAGVTLPELAHAIAAGQQDDLDRATARTRAALDHATDLLVP